MRAFLIATALCLPVTAFAAGSDTSTPPTQTNTTSTCTDGKVWSEATQTCVNPVQGNLDDDTLYQAARELAYAGQYGNALTVLQSMSDPSDDRVLTYLGFTHRKMGDVELGNAYYRQAISRNPDNLLARSYMGQGFVEAGDLAEARTQLTEIRARGGRGTWAELSLRKAIETGSGYTY
jgi:Flp pilus assembly protein TadD